MENKLTPSTQCRGSQKMSKKVHELVFAGMPANPTRGLNPQLPAQCENMYTDSHVSHIVATSPNGLTKPTYTVQPTPCTQQMYPQGIQIFKISAVECVAITMETIGYF